MAHLRIARPTDDLESLARMYAEGLSFDEIGRFDDHDGFDGIILGRRSLGYWDDAGRTFEDPDGYRVVIQNAIAPGEEAPDV